jgi:hypothetical protein
MSTPSRCGHRYKCRTGQIKMSVWPPKRQFWCTICLHVWWEGWMPSQFMESLKFQRALPHIVKPNEMSKLGENEPPAPNCA